MHCQWRVSLFLANETARPALCRAGVCGSIIHTLQHTNTCRHTRTHGGCVYEMNIRKFIVKQPNKWNALANAATALYKWSTKVERKTACTHKHMNYNLLGPATLTKVCY